MDLVLTRTLYDKTHTRGVMFIDDLQLFTLERPWIPNPLGAGGMPRVSCIPEGRYTLKPHNSQKFPGSYMLVNMQNGVYPYPDDIPAGQGWGRSAILIHPANSVDELLGCIAVGIKAEGDRVLQSRDAMGLLRGKLGLDETHRLSIINGVK